MQRMTGPTSNETMPPGSKGRKRPADVIVNTVHVMRPAGSYRPRSMEVIVGAASPSASAIRP